MDNPLVSVIVPVYNQADYLSEALGSVLNQTYKHWECIVINDGSFDDSEKVALDYCKKDNRFSYIFQENQGVVLARNNAIEKSQGKYILPLDGDDYIASDYLELAVDVMEKHPEVKLVYCDVEFFGARMGIYHLPKMVIRNILDTGCCVCTSLFRRESFDEIGGFKEEMRYGLEDWEFFISLMELKGRVYKINKVLFFYRIIEGSRNRSLSPEMISHLKKIVFKLHPNLYFEDYYCLRKEYNELKGKYYSIVNSRFYKFYRILSKVVGKIML